MDVLAYALIGAVLFLFAMYWVIRLAITGAAEDVDRRRAKQYQAQQQAQQYR